MKPSAHILSWKSPFYLFLYIIDTQDALRNRVMLIPSAASYTACTTRLHATASAN